MGQLGREVSRLLWGAGTSLVGLRTVSPFSSQWSVCSPGRSHGPGGEDGKRGCGGRLALEPPRPLRLCVFGPGYPTSLSRLPFPLSFPLTKVPVEYPAINTRGGSGRPRQAGWGRRNPPPVIVPRSRLRCLRAPPTGCSGPLRACRSCSQADLDLRGQ